MENAFYAFFDPKDGKGMQLQLTDIKDTDNLNIAVSQKYALPTMIRSEYRYTCELGVSMCQFILDPDDIDPDKPVYIAFLTQSNFKVIAAPKDELYTEIKAFNPVSGKLVLKDDNDDNLVFKMPFVFNPSWNNYKGSHRSDDQVYVALSTDDQNVKFLEKFSNLDLAVYIGTEPSPERNGGEHISIKDGVFKSTEEGVGARKHKIVKALEDSLLYITVLCEGYDCGSSKLTQSTLYFKLEVNTISEMASYNIHGDSSSTLRDDGTPRALHFQITDEQAALLRVYIPLNANDTTLDDIQCDSVRMTAYLCIGTQPTAEIMQNTDMYESCYSQEIRKVSTDNEQNYIEFDLDSSREKVAAGMVYVVLFPDYSQVIGNASRSCNCKVRYKLFKNE